MIFVAMVYLLPLLLILVIYLARRQYIHHKNRKFLLQSIEYGLTTPASLHPIIDPTLCIGCGSCVSACPENNVLGLIDRHAQLVNPANCIGHGACKTACPQDAIKLVFGSATRGVEIPEISPRFETNIPGIFIAGELGGMGLIRNAIEQGRQAMDSIVDYLKKMPQSSQLLDCVIIGAGPAGLSATLGAKAHGIKSISIDQDRVGGTVSHFPRGKLVMTQPATMPLVGKVKFGEIRKESLMQFWQKIIQEQQLEIQQQESLLSVTQNDQGVFQLKTSRAEYQSRSILLAIGRRGTPRKLGVPGEDSNKVVYRLCDPEQYQGQAVLVVGGGDSALEAACSIAEAKDTKVTLSYRNDSFARAKPKNRARVSDLESSGKLSILFSSQIQSIEPESIFITYDDKKIKLKNDAVIICAGGILPTGLLKATGIKVATKYGTE